MTWRRWIRRIVAAGALAFVALNALLALHAYRFTHFTDSGPKRSLTSELSASQRPYVAAFGQSMPRPETQASPADRGLAFETHSIPNADGMALEAWYLPSDLRAPLIVGLHGYASEKSQLLPQAEALRELGLAVLLVDMRGGGGSPGSATSIGYWEAEDARAAVEYAAETFDPVSLYAYGFSMGGAAVLRAAAIDGLAVDGIIVEAVFPEMLDTVRARFRIVDAPEAVFPEMLVLWGGALHGFWALGHNPAAYCAAIDAPVLVLGGSADDRVPVEDSRRLAASCRNLAGMELFEGAGHAGLVLADRTRWQLSIDSFVRSGAAASAGASPRYNPGSPTEGQ